MPGLCVDDAVPDRVADEPGRLMHVEFFHHAGAVGFGGLHREPQQDRDLLRRFALGDQDSGIRPLASNLYDSSRCRLLILKLGERGVLACCNSDHESLDSFFVIDSFVDRLIDAVGAGDALLAYSTLAMLAVRDPGIATILGSMAAAVECECDGNIPVTADDLRSKIDVIERQMVPA